MAFFKFRKSGDEPSATPVQPDSVEMMRRRAKYRLIGAAVLVLIGVIGFPLLFDQQPRPISVDIPIEIPDKNKAQPLSIPAPVPVPVAVPAVKPEVVTPTPPEAPVLPVAPAAVTAPPVPVTVAKKEPKVVVKSDDGAKARALLEGRVPEKKAVVSEGRFVVQVGAFSDEVRAREVRMKVERAGLKTYTQVVGTNEGQRIRVRVGPFSVKADADKAAEKIKKLDLPASILTL